MYNLCGKTSTYFCGDLLCWETITEKEIDLLKRQRQYSKAEVYAWPHLLQMLVSSFQPRYTIRLLDRNPFMCKIEERKEKLNYRLQSLCYELQNNEVKNVLFFVFFWKSKLVRIAVTMQYGISFLVEWNQTVFYWFYYLRIIWRKVLMQ